MVQRKKLDRILWNMDAQLSFQEAKVFILPMAYSDHNPIMFVAMVGNFPPRDSRLFRFEAVWLTMEDYAHIWKDAWVNREEDILGGICEVVNRSKE